VAGVLTSAVKSWLEPDHFDPKFQKTRPISRQCSNHNCRQPIVTSCNVECLGKGDVYGNKREKIVEKIFVITLIGNA